MNFFQAVAGARNIPATTNGVVTNGLVWHIDPTNAASYPGTGSTIFDLIGSNNGNFEGGTYVDANGHLRLDGVNDAVNFGVIDTTNAIALGAGSFTIQVWGYNVNTLTNIQAMYCQTAIGGDPANRVIMFYYLPYPRFISAMWGPNSEQQQTPNYGPNTTANAWHFYTLRYDSAAGEMTIYVDTTNDPPVTSVINTGLVTRNLRVGSFGTSLSTYEWFGRLGALMQYNRALSASEIAQNYNATKSGYGL